ncbi:MAG: DoxX family protein [Phycisphaerales bacterium]|jgi:hypothetical protein|nr:DoxX family protein [Phycisphaerales bacterium]
MSNAETLKAQAQQVSTRKGLLLVSWLCQIVVAGIFGMTLWFKFTGAPEAVWIFEELGVDPTGRLLAGGIEALVVILILIPRTAIFGALLAFGVMIAAIAAHLLVIGITTPVFSPDGTIQPIEDGNADLFLLAVITAASSLIVILIRWKAAAER